jgi:hypothetical protein
MGEHSRLFWPIRRNDEEKSFAGVRQEERRG